MQYRFSAAAILTLLLALPASAQDPFTGAGGPRGGAGTASFLPGLLASVARQQAALNDTISSTIRDVAEHGSVAGLATILLLSFLFGVLHAVGPGHGKFVISSYLVSQRATVRRGIVMGALVSLVQGLVAILLVALLGILLRLAQFELLDHAATVEAVSYGLILVIGLNLLWHAVRGDAHDHVHVPGLGAEAHAHDDGPCHAHAAARSPARLVLAAGLVPCASAIIVMLFALANNAFLIGVEAALAMSLGMGVTVAGIGVLSVLARRLMLRLAGGATRHGGLVERGLSIAGAGALVLFSGLLLSGALFRL